MALATPNDFCERYKHLTWTLFIEDHDAVQLSVQG